MLKKLLTYSVLALLLAGVVPKLATYLLAARDFSEAEERITYAVQKGRTVLDLDDLHYLRKIPESVHEIKGLWFVDASARRLIDIQSLTGLPDLRHLQLVNTRVLDITPLAKMPSLEVLDIRGAWLADLEPLTHAKRLRWIQMNEVAVRSLCPLQRVVQLNWLNLYKSYAEDGSQACYESLKGRVPELGGGSAYQQNYIPGKLYKSRVSFKQWLQKMEWQWR